MAFSSWLLLLRKIHLTTVPQPTRKSHHSTAITFGWPHYGPSLYIQKTHFLAFWEISMTSYKGFRPDLGEKPTSDIKSSPGKLAT